MALHGPVSIRPALFSLFFIPLSQSNLASQLVDSLGPGSVAFAPCDVTKEENVSAALDLAESTFGTAPNCAVSCAGVAPPGKVRPAYSLAFMTAPQFAPPGPVCLFFRRSPQTHPPHSASHARRRRSARRAPSPWTVSAPSSRLTPWEPSTSFALRRRGCPSWRLVRTGEKGSSPRMRPPRASRNKRGSVKSHSRPSRRS